jgi:altronate dehydratase large subunit
MTQLYGYRRADGRVGFRNHVLVVPLTGCQSEIARRIASGNPGVTCLGHVNGCDLQGPDFDLFGVMLERFATHPNVGGVLLLAMGCAAPLSLQLPRKVRESGRLVETLNTQNAGTTATVQAGTSIVREMAGRLAEVRREPVSSDALVVGTKCGASDENSFRYCHPVVGRACDLLVAEGATVVLSEDCELVAGAGALAGRATTPEIGAKIVGMAERVNAGWTARFGYTLEDLSLKGQTRGKWVERSLAHAAKAGTGPIRGFFEMEEPVRGPGLVVLNAPNTDLECVTALAAAGCQVTLFTTGRGTPVGSPASITVKITATQGTFERMRENIDLCVAGVADGTETLEDAARRIVQAVVESASGLPTQAERLGHWEVAMPIRGVTY